METDMEKSVNISTNALFASEKLAPKMHKKTKISVKTPKNSIGAVWSAWSEHFSISVWKSHENEKYLDKAQKNGH